MCDLIEPQPAEKIGKMKKLRRTLSESFSRIALKKEDTSFDETYRPESLNSHPCEEHKSCFVFFTCLESQQLRLWHEY
ncbi:cyclin-dependent kinase 14-like [Eumetopias jubatus]|uniref:cyclin-dependent kinase 14-like n=1 Tax=Eumetopias jubatus TaxID=34886 RepID=UPI001015E29E|nr:cyclin-dependent kinase 14-like [Eumetopias jubatus]